jgi:hypothetical protein
MVDNFKQWTFEFDQFPIKWIPFVNVEPIFKHPAISSENLDIFVNKLFQTKDTEDDNIKQTRLIVGAYLNADNAYSVETRLIVNIINPEKYF